MLKYYPQAGNSRIALKIIRVGGNSFLLSFFLVRFLFGEVFCHHQSRQDASSWLLGKRV
jgi:hypothetical protein